MKRQYETAKTGSQKLTLNKQTVRTLKTDTVEPSLDPNQNRERLPSC